MAATATGIKTGCKNEIPRTAIDPTKTTAPPMARNDRVVIAAQKILSWNGEGCCKPHSSYRRAPRAAKKNTRYSAAFEEGALMKVTPRFCRSRNSAASLR